MKTSMKSGGSVEAGALTTLRQQFAVRSSHLGRQRKVTTDYRSTYPLVCGFSGWNTLFPYPRPDLSLRDCKWREEINDGLLLPWESLFFV